MSIIPNHAASHFLRDMSRVTKLFPGPHPSADVNRAPRSGDGYKLSPTTKTLLIIVLRDGKRKNNFVTETKIFETKN